MRRSLPRQLDGEEFKLKSFIVVVILDMGGYREEYCRTSGSSVVFHSHGLLAHLNSVPTVCPWCQQLGIAWFEEPLAHQSQLPCPPSGVLSEVDELHGSETLPALTCPCLPSNIRSDPFFKITQRLLGFQFILACFGRGPTFTKEKLPMLSMRFPRHCIFL